MNNNVPPSSSPPKPKHSLVKEVLDSNNESFFKEDCEECGAENTVVLVKDYMLESAEEENKDEVVVPAWVCSHCANVTLEDSSIAIVMNHIEQKNGRTYSRIKVKNGVVMKFNIH